MFSSRTCVRWNDIYQLLAAQLEFKPNNSTLLHFLLNVAVNVLALWSPVFSVQPLAYLTVFLLITEKHDIFSFLCLLKVDFQYFTKKKKKENIIERIISESKNMCFAFNHYLVPHEQEDKSYQKNPTTLLQTCQKTWSAVIKIIWTNHFKSQSSGMKWTNSDRVGPIVFE